MIQGVTTNFQLIRDEINHRDFIAEGGTGTSQAMALARKTLEETPKTDPDAIRVIVFFSDGVPSTNEKEENPDPLGWNWCSKPENRFRCLEISDATEYLPEYPPDPSVPPSSPKYGTRCNHLSIEEADSARVLDQIVFTVFLMNITQSKCDDQNNNPTHDNLKATIDLARLTMLRMSNDDKSLYLPNPGEQYEYYYETDDPGDLEDKFKEIAGTIISKEFFRIREELPGI